jgi:hypothetical protein
MYAAQRASKRIGANDRNEPTVDLTLEARYWSNWTMTEASLHSE